MPIVNLLRHFAYYIVMRAFHFQLDTEIEKRSIRRIDRIRWRIVFAVIGFNRAFVLLLAITTVFTAVAVLTGEGRAVATTVAVLARAGIVVAYASAFIMSMIVTIRASEGTVILAAIAIPVGNTISASFTACAIAIVGGLVTLTAAIAII